jgi:hypothetical protein
MSSVDELIEIAVNLLEDPIDRLIVLGRLTIASGAL